MISGTSARAVASAVIRIGDSRSLAPRTTRSRPKGTPSSSSRCLKCAIIRMPLRAAMPSTVKNPTRAPSVIVPSAPRAGGPEPLKALLRGRALDGFPLEGDGVAGRELEGLQQALHLVRGGAKV